MLHLKATLQIIEKLNIQLVHVVLRSSIRGQEVKQQVDEESTNLVEVAELSIKR